MPFRKTIRLATFDLLLHYLRTLKSHLEYLDERGGVVEEAVAQTAVTELSFVLEDLNALKLDDVLAPSRDAIGDVCHLLITALEQAQNREAVMETFEGVRDIALQQQEVHRIDVRAVDRTVLQEVIDYYFRARALITTPAEELGVDITTIDTPSAITL